MSIEKVENRSLSRVPRLSMNMGARVIGEDVGM